MNKTTKSTVQLPELALDQTSGGTTGTENPNLDVCPSCHYMRLRMELAYQSSASGRWKAHPSAMMPDGARVREAILHLIHRSDTMKFVVTQYDILKALFFADKSHLNRYRRPITFDQYHALPDGPVPSLSYDVLKEALHAFEAIEVDEALWQTEPADGRAIRYFGAQRDGSEEILSESDIEELDAAQDLVLKLGFRGVWNKTHDDPAYQKAWAQRGDAKRFPMQYEDLLERPDPKLIADLAFVSSHG